MELVHSLYKNVHFGFSFCGQNFYIFNRDSPITAFNTHLLLHSMNTYFQDMYAYNKGNFDIFEKNILFAKHN